MSRRRKNPELMRRNPSAQTVEIVCGGRGAHKRFRFGDIWVLPPFDVAEVNALPENDTGHLEFVDWPHLADQYTILVLAPGGPVFPGRPVTHEGDVTHTTFDLRCPRCGRTLPLRLPRLAHRARVLAADGLRVLDLAHLDAIGF